MNKSLSIKLFIYVSFFLTFSTIKSQDAVPKIERIVLDSLDSNKGYYLAVKPKSDKIKGVLFLMPGFGQKAEAVFNDTELYKFAHEQGLLTIAYSTNMRLFADSTMLKNLDKVIAHIISQYKVNADNFALGGFSAGGHILLRYAELCKQYPENHFANPFAVFIADSPIDLFHSWKLMQELKTAGSSQVAVDEANWVEKMYREQYGTTPEESPSTFASFSAFSLDEKHGTKEIYLKDIAIRAYHDVDIPWRLKNRNQTVRHSNYLVTSELINRLMLLGNKQAEFIQSYQTGYRSNGQRHPHSWSIIDAKECVEWVSRLLEDKPARLTPDSTQDDVIIPYIINKESLSGLNLSRGRNPEQPERKLYFQNIFRGKQLNVQIVSSENASASPEDLGIDEFLFLTNGAARLAPKNGAVRTFQLGDFFIVPRGYNGDWETIGAPGFHHEISITTVNRNEQAVNPNKTLPVLMDKRKIAGIGLTETGPGQYYDLLFNGHEITIALEGETPQVKEIKNPLPEQILYVITGTLTLWDQENKAHNFVAGDFIVLPEGFTGTWQSKGQELFRTMSITKSNW